MVEEAKVITYETTTVHAIERFEVTTEIDDAQDISYLDDRNGSTDINHPDAEIRGYVRTDAVIRARHGKQWAQVGVIVRSQPDDVVRASLWGIEVWDSDVYHRNAKARGHADAYFGEVLSDLLTEARDEVHKEHVTDSRKDADRIVDLLPVVGVNGGPMDGAELRAHASIAVDWWTS